MSESREKRNNQQRGGSRPNKGGNRKNLPAFDGEARKEIQALEKQLQPLKSQKDVNSKAFDKFVEENKETRSNIKELNTHLTSLNDKSAKLRQEKEALFKEINGMKEQQKQLRDQLKEARNSLPIAWKKEMKMDDYLSKNFSQLDDQIRTLEESMRTRTGGLQEERAIVSEIEKTRQKKKVVDAYAAKEATCQHLTKKLNELYAQTKVLTPQLNDLDKEKKVIIEKLNAARGKVKENDAEIQKIKDSRAECDKSYKSIQKEIHAKRDALDKKWKAYKAELKEIERKEQEEKKAKENSVEAIMEIQIKPTCVKEIQDLDELLAFLKGIRINKKKPNAPIRHNIDTITKFTKYKLVPPTNGKAIEGSIQQVTEAKEKYIEKQKEDAVRQQAEIEKKKAEALEKQAQAASEESVPKEPAAEPATEEKPAEPAAEQPAADSEAPVAEEAKPEEPAAEAEPVAEQPAAAEASEPAEKPSEE